MKIDMSKILLSDKNNQEEAKKVSVRVFAIVDELKYQFLSHYHTYTSMKFSVKFFSWRMQKLRLLKIPSSFDWEFQIERL